MNDIFIVLYDEMLNYKIVHQVVSLFSNDEDGIQNTSHGRLVHKDQ